MLIVAEKDKKKENLYIRIKPTDKEKLIIMAKNQGNKNISEMVRKLIIREIENSQMVIND